MNKMLLVGIAGLCLAATQAHAGDMDGMDMNAGSGKTMTVVGEVLDMDCYMNEGAHGSGHQSCAVKCLNSGAPVGLLTDDGKAYFLTANEKKGMMKLYEKVRGMGGDRVEITGPMQSRGGTMSIRVDKEKKLK